MSVKWGMRHFWKVHVCEIHVKQIPVNQGLGVIKLCQVSNRWDDIPPDTSAP